MHDGHSAIGFSYRSETDRYGTVTVYGYWIIGILDDSVINGQGLTMTTPGPNSSGYSRLSGITSLSPEAAIVF